MLGWSCLKTWCHSFISFAIRRPLLFYLFPLHLVLCLIALQVTLKVEKNTLQFQLPHWKKVILPSWPFLLLQFIDCWPTHVAFVLISAPYARAWEKSSKEQMGICQKYLRKDRAGWSQWCLRRPALDRKGLCHVELLWHQMSPCLITQANVGPVPTAKAPWRKVSLFQSAGWLVAGMWTLPVIYAQTVRFSRVSFQLFILCKIRNSERRS